MAKVVAFFRLTRPVFLGGGALLYGLGVALAEGSPSWEHYALGQGMVTLIQLTAQYTNEFFDVDADRLVGENRTWLTGGSGVLVNGELAPVVARSAARATTGASLGFLAVVATFNAPAALVGAVGLAGAWAYSAPPPRLVSTPYGVTAASMIVAVGVPITGGLIAGSLPISGTAVIVGALFFLHHAMLLAFERPDLASDAEAGKLTLSVRIGRQSAGRFHAIALVAAFTTLGGGTLAGSVETSTVVWALLAVPLAGWQAAAYFRSTNPVLTTGAVGLFVVVATTLLVGQV